MIAERGGRRAALVCALLVASLSQRARAADTNETFCKGAFGVDLYLGAVGLGATKAAFGELMFSYGLIDRLTTTATVTLQNDERLNVEPRIALGVFGTPLETDHVDLDLLLEAAVCGACYGGLELAPSFELNLDSEDGMLGWGAYLRAGLTIAGDASGEEGVAVRFGATLGGYRTLAGRHQLLLELSMAFGPEDAEEGLRAAELGGVALGYNFCATPILELVSEVSVDLPQPGERVAVSVMAGIIASIPPGYR